MILARGRRHSAGPRLTRFFLLLGLAIATPWACGDAEMNESVSSIAPTLSEIEAKIFLKSCTFSSCHGAAGAQKGLNLTAGAYERIVNQGSTGVSGKILVKPGDLDASYLFEKITKGRPSDGARMPVGQPLSGAAIKAIRDWIMAGAPRD